MLCAFELSYVCSHMQFRSCLAGFPCVHACVLLLMYREINDSLSLAFLFFSIFSSIGNCKCLFCDLTNCIIHIFLKRTEKGERIKKEERKEKEKWETGTKRKEKMSNSFFSFFIGQVPNCITKPVSCVFLFPRPEESGKVKTRKKERKKKKEG